MCAQLSADGAQRWESGKFSIRKNQVTGLFLPRLVRRGDGDGSRVGAVISQQEKIHSFEPSCGSPALLLPLYFHSIDEFAAEISENFHEFSLRELK